MNKYFWILSIFLLLVAGGGAHAKSCDPAFHFTDGWLGGDDAYSVSIPGTDKVLWLFGKTFTGGSKRSEQKAIDNSIAISDCGKTRARVNYYWGFGGGGKIQAFFQSTDPSMSYRPLDAFAYGGKIYVFLSVLSKSGAHSSDVDRYGVKLAVINTPTLVPQAWDISYYDIISSTRFIPGISVMISGAHVYLFGSIIDDLNKNDPIFISRLPLSKLTNAPSENLEYYARDQTWKKVGDLHDAKIIMDRGADEMTVRIHPEIKKWVAIYSKAGSSSEVDMRVSSQLEGPWSEPVGIFDIPEGTPGRLKNPDFDPETQCRSAKEHVELESRKQLKLTYVCGSKNAQKLTVNMELDRPKIVKVPLNFEFR